MKILLCYFSATGNTKKVVDKFAEELTKLGSVVDVHKVENQEFNYDVNDYDAIGIGYPIHGFNAPLNVVQFAKKLPKPAGKKRLIILKTSGEPIKLNNVSSYQIIKILKKKNYFLTNEYHYVMPYNMIFRHSDAMAYKMWNTASRLIPLDAKEVVDNVPARLKGVFMGHTLAWIFRIEHPGAKFIGKRFKVTDKCLKCQKCVRECPTKNITFENGKFKFGKNCLICTRCSFNCPANAINIGLLEGWKVNGQYNFNNPDDTYQKSHKNYCKNAYKKYFERSEKKIEAASNNN